MKRMCTFSGDQLAQVDNADPFALPIWRSPVYHTPGWMIAVVQIARASGPSSGSSPATPSPPCRRGTGPGLARFGWPGPVLQAASLAAVLAVWWWRWPASFPRLCSSGCGGSGGAGTTTGTGPR